MSRRSVRSLPPDTTPAPHGDVCYNVEARDYDYEALFEMVEADCDCGIEMHLIAPACQKVCEHVLPPFLQISEDALFDYVIPGLILFIVFCVGTIGNAMVIFVVNRFKRMRNVTNVFLASLSTADICLIWFCVPIMFIKYTSNSWGLGRFACYFVHYIQQFTCFCSVLTMTMISFERFLAIAYPMRNIWISSIGRAKKAILVIWISSAILSLPTALRIEYTVVQDANNNGTTTYWCERKIPQNLFGYDSNYLDKIYAVYQLILLILFPVSTMSICYARVSAIVYRSSKDRVILSQAMVAFSKAATDAVTFSGYSAIPMITTSKNLKTANTTINSYTKHRSNRVAEANKKQIVQMLISIVVMFTFCWLPTIVDELLTSFGFLCRTSNTPLLRKMRMGFNCLTYCQSCINPILYAFISQNFRSTFKTAYSRMKNRLQGVEEMRSRMGSCSSASMMSTRNQHRIYGSSFNTLTVPGRTMITPNMSRDVSQLSLCRPGSQMSFNRSKSPISHDMPSTAFGRHRPRSPTDVSRDSGRPRSPTDLSQSTKPSRRSSSIRPRSPTTVSQMSMVVRSRSPTGNSDCSSLLPSRTRSPTLQSTTSGQSRGSIERTADRLSVRDAVRPKTPPCFV
ncbi:unnamed protein product [Caenorhabditis angaria]|uniref:G-protein coupled receptors family 1 profile domain-containing protein n=1 Tax=Caenorhabditis angaria TaxID=860376 RepID=A0A9P1MUK4_9PELO|nr:unnamed protein product [Caenorhabditis angaria]